MDIILNAEIYKNQIIIEDEPACDVIVANVNSPECGETNMSFQEVIVCVDTSLSMSESLQTLLETLRCLHNFLSDTTFIVITFDNVANVVWNSSIETNITFEEMLAKIKVGSMTNLSSALRTSFKIRNPRKYGWIIILTDGMPNIGEEIYHKDFKEFVSANRPPKTRIISFGFRQNFDSILLCSIGHYDKIESDEQIASSFGALTGEIRTTFCYDTQWDIPGGDILFGSEFASGILSSGKNSTIVRKCINVSQIQFSYTKIDDNKKSILSVPVTTGETIDTDMIENCYLFRATQLALCFDKESAINAILHRINRWTSPYSERAKTYIRKAISSIRSGGFQNTSGDIAANLSALTTQTGYTPLFSRSSGSANFSNSQILYRERFLSQQMNADEIHSSARDPTC